MSTLKVSEILNHLSNGVTRSKTSKNYNPEYGSLTEKYDVSAREVDEWFKHPALKGKKTKQPFKAKFTIIDDTDQDVIVINDTMHENLNDVNQKILNEIYTEGEEIDNTPF